jgi:CubicO group peptidase (beta-lactamase class C family)
MTRLAVSLVWVVLLLTCPAAHAAEASLSAEQQRSIDSAVNEALSKLGIPSASIAVVKDRKIAYLKAYGTARLPDVPATTAMRYPIGSVSKQISAAAILLLVEDGKLSLEDRVGKWLPELTRAQEVSIRQLLSMTAGYQDYWPQDYVVAAMLKPTTPKAIVDQWAKKPLDFEPGAQWQYSSTNYMIAGLIVEKTGGMPLHDFLRQRIFAPLKMTTVADADASAPAPEDAEGYLRNALGPLRPAPKAAPGWLYASGAWSMTAHDLALWNISVMNRSLLKPQSYEAMSTATRLASGVAIRYALGVGVGMPDGTRRLAHDGAISGFTSTNKIYPEAGAAVTVLMNLYPGATNAPSDLADRIARTVLPAQDPGAKEALDLARKVFAELRSGTLDRSRLTDNANQYFTEEVLRDFATTLGPLGAPSDFQQNDRHLRGGMTMRGFEIKAGTRTMSLFMRTLPDGRIEQYVIEPSE